MTQALAITSYCAVSALGLGSEETLANLLAETAPGMREISGDIPGRSVWFGSVLAPLPEIGEARYDMRTCRLLALVVSRMRAELDSLIARYGSSRVAIVLGTSNTGVDEAHNHIDTWLASGTQPEKFRLSLLELGTPAMYLKDALGTTGLAYSISTACTSSAKVFPAAARLIARGLCDAAIVGGADGRCRFALNGFNALGALSQGRCRPLSPDRDGINLGEGAALFTLEQPREGARVLFAGAGESSDAHHATAPDPEGRGAEAAMRAALAAAALEPGDIDYINLHGTGTLANDDMEAKAVARVFGSFPPPHAKTESTKRLTGHALGAAGAIEAAIALDMISSGRARRALSNSFAFGGSNASVIFTAG